MATIKTKLEASGVSSYRSQMTAASKAVKTLGAELRQAEAEYKATGDQAAYMAQKSGILQQQIEEQKRAVESAEKGLAAMKKQYGENSTQVMEWRTKLAQAKTQLTTMQTELRSTTAALDAMGNADVDDVADDLKDVTKEAGNAEDAADDLSEAVGDIAGKLDSETIIDGLESISQKMLGVVRTAGQMGKAIWEASVDAADWADSTNDAAKAADMGVEEYQRVRYAAQFFGLTVDDLVGKQGKLTQAMDESGRIMVGDWAIDTIDRVTGKKRAFSNVMLDIVEGLNLIEDPVQRDQEAMRVFGESYAEMRGLMDDADSWQSRINEAPVVSKASVESLSDTSNEIKTMNSELEVLKMELLATLAPDIKLIAEAVGDLAKQLTAFVQSEQGQALLAKLSESIASIITSLTEQDFDGIVSLATKAIEGLTTAFSWISDNQESIIGAITAIGGAFLAFKGISLGLNAVNLINSFKGLMGHGGAAAGAGSGAGAGAGAGAGSGSGAASAAGAGAGGKLALNFAGAGGLLAQSAGVFAAAVTPAVLAQNWDVSNRGTQISTQVAQAEAAAEELGESATEWMDIVHIAADAVGIDPNDRDWLGQVKLGDPRRVMEGIQALAPYADMLSGVVSGGQMKELEALWYHPEDSTLTDADVNGLMESILTGVSSHMGEIEDAGEDAALGLGDGLLKGEPTVEGVSEDLAWDVLAAALRVLDEHSPSKAMAEIGLNAALGLAQGIDEGAKAAIASASAMAGAVASIVASAMMSLQAAILATSRAAGGYGASGSGGFVDSSTTINIGSYNQNGGGDMYALADLVASAQKSERQGFGRRG